MRLVLYEAGSLDKKLDPAMEGSDAYPFQYQYQEM